MKKGMLIEQSYQDIILDNTSHIYLVIDETGKIQYISPSVKRILGYESIELTGKSLFESIFYDDRKLCKETMDGAFISPDATLKRKFHILNKNGICIYTENEIRSVKTGSGDTILSVESTILTTDDIPDESLSVIEEEFKKLLGHSILWIYLIQDNRIIYVNERLSDICRYMNNEMTGMSIEDIVFEDEISLVKENIHKRETGEMDILHYEFRAVTKDKEIKYLEVYGSGATPTFCFLSRT